MWMQTARMRQDSTAGEPAGRTLGLCRLPSGATVSPVVACGDRPAQPLTSSRPVCLPLLYAAAVTSSSTIRPARAQGKQGREQPVGAGGSAGGTCSTRCGASRPTCGCYQRCLVWPAAQSITKGVQPAGEALARGVRGTGERALAAATGGGDRRQGLAGTLAAGIMAALSASSHAQCPAQVRAARAHLLEGWASSTPPLLLPHRARLSSRGVLSSMSNAAQPSPLPLAFRAMANSTGPQLIEPLIHVRRARDRGRGLSRVLRRACCGPLWRRSYQFDQLGSTDRAFCALGQLASPAPALLLSC